jgi:hypothetical protein
MTISHETLKAALGEKYDPTADYLVCGYNDLHLMQAKGYPQVGTIQDPTPADQDLLVFVRPKPPPPPEPVKPPPPPEPPPPLERTILKKRTTRFGL